MFAAFTDPGSQRSTRSQKAFAAFALRFFGLGGVFVRSKIPEIHKKQISFVASLVWTWGQHSQGPDTRNLYETNKFLRFASLDLFAAFSDPRSQKST